MSLWAFMWAPKMAPFAGALSLVLAFFVVEMLTLLVGGSLFGADVDSPDIDLDIDAGIEIDADIEIDVELAEAETEAGASSGGAGLLGWLGFGRVPFLVWLTAFLIGFGSGGYILQVLSESMIGAMLPLLIAVPLALLVGAPCSRYLSMLIAHMLPQIETSAVSERHLGGCVGKITLGQALTGKPAEARVNDVFGNSHYIRVEPQKSHLRIEEGSEIVVLGPKARESTIYLALPLEN